MRLIFTVTLDADEQEIRAWMKHRKIPADLLNAPSVLQLSDFEDSDFFDLSDSELRDTEP